MKILCWNVNGIRACDRNGFLDWMKREAADLVCLQETKAHPDQLGEALRQPTGYHAYWHSAEKRGYSGVATFCRRKPSSVHEGIGIAEIDREGRVLVTEYRGFVLINAYFPNSQRDHARLGFKLEFCRAMRAYMDELCAAGKNVVVCGDYNIAHREIDLANPKQNEKNAGFLPEERAWMTELLDAGYVDAFRDRCDEPGHYTWWSYRAGVRERNVGWRLDYFVVNPEFKRRVRRCFHQPEVMGADHCPIGLEIR